MRDDSGWHGLSAGDPVSQRPRRPRIPAAANCVAGTRHRET